MSKIQVYRSSKKANQRLRLNSLNIGGIALIVSLALLSAGDRVLAHHATGGKTPSNFFEGFLSGAAHPVIGLDHLAFVVAVGLLSAGMARSALIPAGFVLAALAGTGIHLLSLDLPIPEVVISVSVIAFGAMLAMQNRISWQALLTLAAFAGLFHGYAYGEAIVGAGMTPLLAYLLGFSLIQYAVAMGAQAIAKIISQRNWDQRFSPMRLAGYAICIIGAVFLTTSLVG